jgi:CDP-diacylglycerol---glycerol-3-phosphate 3-phosphatidyltransferase
MKMPGSSPEETMSNSFLYRQTPNLITSSRIAVVPIVIWLIVAEWDSYLGRSIALVLLVAAASTDGIDGAIARKRNLVSNLGKILDPIADKTLLTGALIALSIQGAVPWLATGLILARELGITVYRLVVVKKRVIAATGGGKFKTVMQVVAVSLFVAPFGILGLWYLWLSDLVLWFTVALTLWTGLRILWLRKS